MHTQRHASTHTHTPTLGSDRCLRRLEYMPSHTMVRCACAVRSTPSEVLYITPVTTCSQNGTNARRVCVWGGGY